MLKTNNSDRAICKAVYIIYDKLFLLINCTNSGDKLPAGRDPAAAQTTINDIFLSIVKYR
jgi:hypothetical protein